MKVLYIHQNFVTREGSGITRPCDLTQHLASMGHEVTVICGLYDQSGLKSPARWQPFGVQTVGSVEVVVCNVRYSNKMGLWQRLWSLIGFALLATVAALRQRRPDVVFASSPALESTIAGVIGAYVHRAPYVFEVRDLWPEDIVDAGRIRRGGLTHRYQTFLEWLSYRVARRIVLVSQGFHDRLLERGYPDSVLQTVMLGGDGPLFEQQEPDLEFVRALGLEGKFVAVYAGAHGTANGLGQVLDAAAHLLDRPDVALVLIGDGKEREHLTTQVKQRGLANVVMVGPVPKTRIPGILAAGHVGLLILTQIPRPRWVVPNKLFDYMFAGLPTIVNFAGTSSDFVESEKVGKASVPGSAEDLAAKIRYYADEPKVRQETGRHARDLAWAKYDRRAIAAQMAAVFQSALLARPRRTD
jgi:glycosyltransferase involved in cell wall biosynthesis